MKNIAYRSVSGLCLGHTSEVTNHFCFIQKGQRIVTEKKQNKKHILALLDLLNSFNHTSFVLLALISSSPKKLVLIMNSLGLKKKDILSIRNVLIQLTQSMSNNYWGSTMGQIQS